MELMLFVLASLGVATMATIVHFVVRKRVNHQPLSHHNEVTAAVYATFGVLYAVILGLLVSHGQSRRDIVSEASVREAALLVDVAQIGQSFDSTTATHLTKACLAYTRHVASIEWPLSSREEVQHTHREHLDELWSIVRSIEPQGARQEAVYKSLLEIMGSLASERYERHAAMGDHMSFFLKLVLLVGGLVTVVFLWFFGVQDARLHLVYTWLVTFMLILVLGLIFALDNPLRAGVGVDPSDFYRAEGELRTLLEK